MAGIEETLNERGARYGDRVEQFGVAQAIKELARDRLASNPHYARMAFEDKRLAVETIDMIATKLSRVICGDPAYADNWHDIAGYATIAKEHFNGE